MAERSCCLKLAGLDSQVLALCAEQSSILAWLTLHCHCWVVEQAVVVAFDHSLSMAQVVLEVVVLDPTVDE